jgi:prevent-host-death family protein
MRYIWVYMMDGEVVQRIGTRELKQHTGEIIARVQRGEQVIITLRGQPVAVLVPIEQSYLEAITPEAGRAKQEALWWLKASESAFNFWDNEEDAVWDSIELR